MRSTSVLNVCQDAVIMVQTSARLLALLSLLQVRREWTGQELADRLEVGERTIRRDVEKLRSLGYPVQASPGVAGGYRLRAGAELPPLLLDDEEAVAVAVGLRSSVAGSVAGMEETSIRALAKLEQVLPPRLRRRVGALGANTFGFSGAGGPQVDADQLATIAAACRDRVRLRFGYTSKVQASTRRHTEPHSLVHSGWRWYLVAFDVDRDDWRTFRVDRIAGRLTPGARCPRRTLPDGVDPGVFVQRGLRGGREEQTAAVRLHVSAASIAGRIPERYGSVEPIDDSSCLFHARADWRGGLAVYIALLGVDFTVLEPRELAEQVRELGARFTRAVPA
jgi:predicted DNA-binding transcriptional regulator YafY